jgi:hypothetical protein
MDAVFQRLVRPDDGLLLLFTPPFDRTRRDPGYIKGYLPGIRENGGQYTHAAVWTAWAFAEMGRTQTAETLFRLLNPIYHADTRQRWSATRSSRVMAADIYGVAPHGRGGWTWYTGSAAWMYRLGLEGILVHRVAGGLLIARASATWPGYEATYRYGAATYQIRVRNGRVSGEPAGAILTIDGRPVPGNLIELHDDGARIRSRSGSICCVGAVGVTGQLIILPQVTVQETYYETGSITRRRLAGGATPAGVDYGGVGLRAERVPGRPDLGGGNPGLRRRALARDHPCALPFWTHRAGSHRQRR